MNHKNAILLVSFKKIKNYIIFFIFFERHYICWIIVGIIEKDKFSLLQYNSAKYLFYTYIFNQNQINFNQNFIKITISNLHALAQ